MSQGDVVLILSLDLVLLVPNGVLFFLKEGRLASSRVSAGELPPASLVVLADLVDAEQGQREEQDHRDGDEEYHALAEGLADISPREDLHRKADTGFVLIEDCVVISEEGHSQNEAVVQAGVHVREDSENTCIGLTELGSIN